MCVCVCIYIGVWRVYTVLLLLYTRRKLGAESRRRRRRLLHDKSPKVIPLWKRDQRGGGTGEGGWRERGSVYMWASGVRRRAPGVCTLYIYVLYTRDRPPAIRTLSATTV